MKYINYMRIFVGVADSIGKIGGLIVVIVAVLMALPITSGAKKAITGWLYGVQGAVYYEVGPNGDAMFTTNGKVDGGLFLLRDGDRNYGSLRWGDVLQAGTEKTSVLLRGHRKILQVIQRSSSLDKESALRSFLI